MSADSFAGFADLARGRPCVIGLSGAEGAGKSTAAAALAGLGFRRMPFAGPLKAVYRAMLIGLGFSPEACDARIAGALKEVPDTEFSGKFARALFDGTARTLARDALAQLDGFEATSGAVLQFLDVAERQWLFPGVAPASPRRIMQTLGTEWGRVLHGPDFWVEQWQRATADMPLLVAEDCRFANEAEAIRARGGLVFEVEAPWAPRASGPDAHASQVLPFTPDGTLQNRERGRPQALQQAAREAAFAMLGGG